MNACRFLFVGNRRFVLEQMLRAGLEIAGVFIIKGTHLERDLQNGLLPKLNNIQYIGSKVELLELVRNTDFDVLISNGCPHILPVEDLPRARYINIHPSYLPDLRGADPTIGSVLLKRDSGATCHVMDTEIDTGPIISRLRIPFTNDLDVTTLYQLSFFAEQKVFSQALALGFEPQYKQPNDAEAIYYSRKPADQVISFSESNDLILQKIKAFNNRSQGCSFSIRGISYRVFSAQRMHNPFILELMEGFPDYVVGMSYENGILFRKDGEVLRFLDILPANGEAISIGTNVFQP